tara:strand:+ start:403 stop:1041 length:639 start_codon:yes stop_codon:yes gene_type:complete
MHSFDLFPTKLWMGKLDLDVPMVLDKLLEWTNNGGSVFHDNRSMSAKGDGFTCEDLSKAIKDNIPKREGLDVGELYIHYWVNFNPPGAFNHRHHHTDNVILFSGVYYLRVPPKSGRIIFHDPRGLTINSMADARYFGTEPEVTIDPQPGMIVYFPSWLEHEVENNEGDSERVSIAFNIISKMEFDRYKAMEGKFMMNATSTGTNGNTEFFSG